MLLVAFNQASTVRFFSIVDDHWFASIGLMFLFLEAYLLLLQPSSVLSQRVMRVQRRNVGTKHVSAETSIRPRRQGIGDGT
jgi:hypothetical protein